MGISTHELYFFFKLKLANMQVYIEPEEQAKIIELNLASLVGKCVHEHELNMLGDPLATKLK